MKRFIRPIYAAAMKRREYADWIEDTAIPIMEVLAQLYLFPDTEYENHWRKELYSRLYRTKLLKGGSLPDANLIYRSTWGLHRRSVDRVVQYILDKEYQLTPRADYSIDTYISICEEYFRWISNELSKNEILLRTDLYEKLDEMHL